MSLNRDTTALNRALLWMHPDNITFHTMSCYFFFIFNIVITKILTIVRIVIVIEYFSLVLLRQWGDSGSVGRPVIYDPQG